MLVAAQSDFNFSCNIALLLFLQTYQNNLIKTSSVSQQIYNWGIELEQTGNEKLMEECWPEWQSGAAQSFTTLYISDTITEGFFDDKKCTADMKRCKYWTAGCTTESHPDLLRKVQWRNKINKYQMLKVNYLFNGISKNPESYNYLLCICIMETKGFHMHIHLKMTKETMAV